MDPAAETNPRASLLQTGFFAIAIAALAGSVWFLATDFASRVESLAKAQSDNVQWALSQVEVEFLVLDHSLLDGQILGPEILPVVRKNFDVLYSRVDLLSNSGLYAAVREQPDFNAALTETRTAITEMVPLIDGPDDRLYENLENLHDRLTTVRQSLRSLGLVGISFFAEQSDARRAEIALTLNRVAAITLALMIILTVLLFVLWRFSRVMRSNANNIRLSADRMSAIVTSALDAVVVADRNGVIQEFNGGAEEIFGYRREQALGRTIGDIMVPEHLRKTHDDGMARYLSTGEKRIIGKGRKKLDSCRADGSIFPVELSVSSTRQHDGSEIYVAFIRDITSREATEQALRQARDNAMAGERAKAELLAVMSHEMRTPLNGMLGTLELLGETDLTDRQSKYLSVANRSGNLLLHHVNDVLDIARLNSGKMSIERRPINLSDLVRELVEGQQTTADAAGNTIDATLLPPEKAMVMCDPVRLRQILLNLVGNAVKFTQNGTIQISVDRLGYDDMVEINVADTGIGIFPEDVDRVFSDFVTLDTTYDRQNTGTGLGLGIARRMARAMGGDIGVESEPGEGSLFWVRIPMPEIPHDALAGKTAPASAGDGREKHVGPPVADATPLNVLVVEDNEINRLVVREMLEMTGHNVTEAVDGLEGANTARDHHFDLILMDISMPQMNGIEATRLIRSRPGASAGTPIVALTAHAMAEEITRFKEAGMDHSLTKPISRETLQSAIDLAHGKAAKMAPATISSAVPGDPAGPVDLAALSSIKRDVGADRLTSLIATFLTEADATVDRLIKAADEPASDCTSDLLATVHHLAGSAAVFGARDLHRWLAEMEGLGKSGKMSDVHARLPEVAVIWDRTRSTYSTLHESEMLN